MRRYLLTIFSVIAFILAGAYGIVAAAAGLASIGILLALDYDVDVRG